MKGIFEQKAVIQLAEHARPNIFKVLLQRRYLIGSAIVILGGSAFWLTLGTSHAQGEDAGFHLGSPGQVTSTNTVSGGSKFSLVSKGTDPSLKNQQGGIFEYAVGQLYLNGVGGGGSTTYQHWQERYTHSGKPVTTGGGYLFIAPSDSSTSSAPNGSNLDNWISVLKGNPAYVKSNLWFDKFALVGGSSGGPLGGGSSETLINLAKLVEDTGAAFYSRYFVGQSSYTQQYLMVTNPPKAQVQLAGPSGTYGSTVTVGQGQPVSVHDIVSLQSFYASYHFEYLRVTNAQGQDVTSQVFSGPEHSQSFAIQGGPTVMVQTPRGPQQMFEVQGGGIGVPTAALANNGVSGSWETYTNGALTSQSGYGQPSGGSRVPKQITLDTSRLPNGKYTVTLYSEDYYQRTARPVTATFTIGRAAQDAISLTASPANPQTGSPSTLTAKVVTPPGKDHYTIKIVDDGNLRTLAYQNSATDPQTNQSSYSTNATAVNAESDTYTAWLIDQTTGKETPSNTVTVTWSGTGTPPPGGGGGGGLCPAPYVSGQQWVSLGAGNQELKWVLNTPTPQYHWVGPAKHRRYVFWYCKDVTTPESKYYPAQVGSGQVTGLSYDPGTPLYMWLPTSVQQWSLGANPGGFWSILNAAHGWSGFEQGGPDASQVTGTYIVRGQKYYQYGSSSQEPWVWARPDSGVGFRVQWVGSPDAIPQSGRVLYTMINPSDGAKRQWSQKLVLNESTLFDQGTQFQNLTPPSDAEEFVSAWSQIPKHVLGASGPELANWSLSSSPQTAFANGAHISVQVQINTTAGTVTYDVPSMVCLFSYPAWYMNQIHSTTANGQTYVGTTPAKDGQP